MPRKGYRTITLSEADYWRLEEKARLYGTSIQDIIKIAVSDETLSKSFPGALVISGSNPDGPTIRTFIRPLSRQRNLSYLYCAPARRSCPVGAWTTPSGNKPLPRNDCQLNVLAAGKR